MLGEEDEVVALVVAVVEVQCDEVEEEVVQTPTHE